MTVTASSPTFGILEEPIVRLLGVPAGAKVDVRQFPEKQLIATVTVGNKRTHYHVERTEQPGVYRLAFPSHVEYADRGVPPYIIEMVGFVLYYAIWPVWFVIDILVRDYRAHRDMLDSKCPD